MLKGDRATPSLILFSRVQRSWKCKNILCGRECTVSLPDGRTVRTSEYYRYFLQCFDTVGGVVWPRKTRPRQCQSTEGSSSPIRIRLQSHQVHRTMLQYYNIQYSSDTRNTYIHKNESKQSVPTRPTSVPSGILIYNRHGPKLGAVPLLGHSPTMWPGTRPTSMPFYFGRSNRLATVHQHYRQDRADRQTDRQTGQRSDSIGWTVLQTVAQKRFNNR